MPRQIEPISRVGDDIEVEGSYHGAYEQRPTRMAGESRLKVLLRSMRPRLHEGEYVFCATEKAPADMTDLEVLGHFREAEGVTLILRREQADDVGLSYGPVFQMITLDVHSSLEAVGFLAAISSMLAEHGIAINVISAYYHDHLFVPASRSQEALDVVAPDIVLVDPRFRDYLARAPSRGNEADIRFAAWLARHRVHLVATVDDPTYGRIEIYRVNP